MFIWETVDGACDCAGLSVGGAPAASPFDFAPHNRSAYTRRTPQIPCDGRTKGRQQPAVGEACERPPAVSPAPEETLKSALRYFAKSVTVISCAHSGKRYAMTATAVTEVCLEPPTMLICVNRSASLLAPLTAARYFAINILDRSQKRIAEDCGGRKTGAARFDDFDWAADTLQTPYLRNAQATIFCSIARTLTFGTHTVIVASVESARSTEGAKTPLIYLDRRYVEMGLDPVLA